MDYGEKIALLRKNKGMTQAELGSTLNVTFQAVSKWERGESLPDFDTMSRMAELFGVPLEYFREDYEYKKENISASDAKMLGVCTKCGKVVYEGQECNDGHALVCRTCAERARQVEIAKRKALEKKEESERQAAKVRFNEKVGSVKRKRRRGFIIGGIVSAVLLVFMIIAICTLTPEDKVTVGEIIGSYIFLMVFGFTFAAQLAWGGIVRSICTTGGKIIGTPGIIFSFDIDGCFFLIGMKILFALLKVVVFLATSLFFVIIAFLISPFSFIPYLLRINKNVRMGNAEDDFDDDLD